MLAGYKVLKAVESFTGTSFTASELADVSGVNLKTVQTVIRRNDNLVEHDSSERTGGRGRPTVRYRLRAGAAGTLRERLAAVEQAIAPAYEEPPVPAALLAAEEMLYDPSVEMSEQLLMFARIGVAAAKRVPESRRSAALAARTQAAEALLALAELQHGSERERTPARLAGTKARLDAARAELSRHAPAALDGFDRGAAR